MALTVTLRNVNGTGVTRTASLLIIIMVSAKLSARIILSLIQSIRHAMIVAKIAQFVLESLRIAQFVNLVMSWITLNASRNAHRVNIQTPAMFVKYVLNNAFCARQLHNARNAKILALASPLTATTLWTINASSNVLIDTTKMVQILGIFSVDLAHQVATSAQMRTLAQFAILVGTSIPSMVVQESYVWANANLGITQTTQLWHVNHASQVANVAIIVLIVQSALEVKFLKW